MPKNKIAVNEVDSLANVKPDYAAVLVTQLKQLGLPAPVREFQFCEGRKLASDVAFPEHMLLIEIEGGVYSNGRHTRGKGYTDDCVKYNLAALLGYTVLRFTPGMIQNGRRMVWDASDTIMAYLASCDLSIARLVDAGMRKGLQKVGVTL